MFDYERHDTYFSETKIGEMQKYFADAADTGKLYINYPMIESYQHLKALPNPDYTERKILVSLQPGKRYKALVRKETVIAKSVEFPHKIEELLRIHFNIKDEQILKKCYHEILTLSDESNLDERIQDILQNTVSDERIPTAKYQFKDMVVRQGYAHDNL